MALLVALVALGSAAARAQAPKPELQRALERARVAFDRRAFLESAELLREAHAIEAVPLLLYNVGRSYQEAGMAEQALGAYAEFLLADPQGEERALVQQRVRECIEAKGKPPLPACGGITCPVLPGYEGRCNTRGGCELTPTAKTGDAWVWLPGGSYAIGSPESERGLESERPQHQVTLRGVLIGKHPVTVARYEACVAAGRCTPASVADWDGDGWDLNTGVNGRADHPQNGVQWEQARAVCAFLGGRLLTEAEWEAAASGPLHRLYPWGDAPAPACDNDTALWDEARTRDGYGCGTGGTAAVGGRAAGASAVGALDMAGNVWEWVEDCWHDSWQGAPMDGGPWTTGCAGGKRVIRGGSFYSDSPTDLRAARRDLHIPTTRRAHIGARCALEIAGPDAGRR